MSPADAPGGEHQAAFEMTENMPVGMFVTEMLPDGTRQSVFVSNRLLDMLGLEREPVMQDWRAIYAQIHPDDLAGFLRPSEESWHGITVFRWEGRPSSAARCGGSPPSRIRGPGPAVAPTGTA